MGILSQVRVERKRQRRRETEKELIWKKIIGLEKFEDADKKVALHMSSFDNSSFSDNPYAKVSLIPPEEQKKFCLMRIEEIKKRIAEYYRYTDGRVKPEDLHEICLYRNELKKLNSGNDPYQQGKALTEKSVQPASRDIRARPMESLGVLHFLKSDHT
jgi:hypothetical protein